MHRQLFHPSPLMLLPLAALLIFVLVFVAIVVRAWRAGPAGQVTTGPIVDAADGAVGEQWVCHQGAWLVRVHH